MLSYIVGTDITDRVPRLLPRRRPLQNSLSDRLTAWEIGPLGCLVATPLIDGRYLLRSWSKCCSLSFMYLVGMVPETEGHDCPYATPLEQRDGIVPLHYQQVIQPKLYYQRSFPHGDNVVDVRVWPKTT